MKKIILILLVFFGFSNAKEYTVNTYTVVIDVNSTKVNGLSWDFVGGSPDIFIKVDNREVKFNSKCKNQYRCSITFISEEKSYWYFEVYDKDVNSDDLIGKGECLINKECQLGQASLFIRD